MSDPKTPKWLSKLANKITKPFADKGVQNVKAAINREFVQPAKEKQDITPIVNDFGEVILGIALIGTFILIANGGAAASSAAATVAGVTDGAIKIGRAAGAVNITYNYYYGVVPPTPMP